MRLLVRINLLIACLCLSLWAGVAQAQRAPDYATWENIAARAEVAITEGEVSNSVLEDLRSQIAAFREQFLSAQSQNAERIQTLQSQLEALGSPPESGDEAPEIVQRRSELNAQLTNLRAPVVAAEEAYTRANGLVGEIDTTLRERQKEALFSLGPAPVNPTHFPGAISEIHASAVAFWREIGEVLRSQERRADLRSNLPAVIALLALSIVLLARGRRWVTLLVERLRKMTRPGTGVWSFLVSIGQILVPMAGIFTLTAALQASGMVGERGSLLLDRLPIWAGVLLVIRWLAEQVFPKRPIRRDTQLLHIPRRSEARFYITVLAGLLVLRGVRLALTEPDDIAPATLAVLEFPILILSGLALFRLGQILRGAKAPDGDIQVRGLDGVGFRLGLARYLGLLAMFAGIVGPVLAAIGYVRVGEFLVYPTILTMGIAAMLVVLQRFVSDLYELFTGKTVAEANSLIPVLAGFALSLASLPLLALTWGARVSDLTEVWARFREGFVIGETRISPTDFLTFALVFAVVYTLTRLFQGALRTSVLPKTKLDVGGQNAIVSGIGYVGVFLAAIAAITTAGIDLSSLAIVAGALSVGIGFGLQTIVSNFVSGIILLVERPISEGDWIEVGGQMGTVKDISVRSTRIETFDRTDVIVPNADLVTGTVTNYTRGNTLGRVIVSVGVAYGTDTREVENILMSIARAHPNVMMNPEPFIYFKGFGADSLDFEIRAILSDVFKMLVVQTDMHHEIAKRFHEEGIEIPFAQRDVWLRNPEALHDAGTAAPARPDTEPNADSEPRESGGGMRAAGLSEDAGDATDTPDSPDGDR